MRRVDFYQASGSTSGNDSVHPLQRRPRAYREGLRLGLLSRALLLLAILPLPACLGVFADDGRSVSVGTHAKGALLRGIELPADGAGYRVPDAWRTRGRQFGTEEMVRWLTDAFRAAQQSSPDSVAALGDVSALGGGRSREH